MIDFLLNNLWLVFVVYGIWKVVTKNARQAQTAALLKAADAKRAAGTEEADAVAAGHVRYVDASGRVVSDRTPQPSDAAYAFVDPVAEEEAIDEQERIAAFQYHTPTREKNNEQDEVLQQARRELETNLQKVYATPTVAEIAQARINNPLGFSPDEIRRAVILTEILQPPRSRRPIR